MDVFDPSAFDIAHDARSETEQLKERISKIEEVVNENYMVINCIDKKLDAIIKELNLEHLFVQEQENQPIDI